MSAHPTCLSLDEDGLSISLLPNPFFFAEGPFSFLDIKAIDFNALFISLQRMLDRTLDCVPSLCCVPS